MTWRARMRPPRTASADSLSPRPARTVRYRSQRSPGRGRTRMRPNPPEKTVYTPEELLDASQPALEAIAEEAAKVQLVSDNPVVRWIFVKVATHPLGPREQAYLSISALGSRRTEVTYRPRRRPIVRPLDRKAARTNL